MKSDAELVKQKARQMLIDKDEEIERVRSKLVGQPDTPAKDGSTPTKAQAKEFAAQ